MSGNMETGRISTDKAPMIMVTSEMTIANIGRLMKKLDMLMPLTSRLSIGFA